MDPKQTPEQIYDTRYLGGDPTQPDFNPSKAEYTKTKLSFTAEEIQKMTPLDTIVQMGQIAQSMLDRYVQTDPLIRLGVKNSEDTAILYDIPRREIVIYSPKIWCSNCQSRKGSYMYDHKVWCQQCLAQNPNYLQSLKEQANSSTESQPKPSKKKK